MDEITKEPISQNTIENQAPKASNNSSQTIAAAIIVAGIIIAGAIFLKDAKPSVTAGIPVPTTPTAAVTLAPVSASDRVLGNTNAKVTVVLYEDFQCPFCGRFFADAEKQLRDNYVTPGKVELVYRDFAFLGTESTRAAEAAMCANDQGKFWQYHDYLFSHQNGENQGAFADNNLESFAQTLGLDSTAFNQCFTSNKYAQAVADSKTEGGNAGVQGTPKGFILRGGKIVATIDGAQPWSAVQPQIDAALK